MADSYAARHGLTIDTSVTLEDRGISAHRGLNRTEGALGLFADMVKAGEIEEGSFLLIENLDRYSRQNPIEAASALQKLCLTGITVVTLNDEQVFTKDSLVNNIGSILQAILGFERAYKESHVKGQRLSAAWSQKRVVALSGGAPLTAVGPSWLKLDREAGQFVVIPERAEIVKRIFNDALHGLSPHTIAHAFNIEDVPVFGRGKQWHRSFVVKILANRSVIGVMTPHTLDYVADPKDKFAPEKRQRTPTQEIPDYFPAVIDEQTFLRVQALRKSHKEARSPRGYQAGKMVGKEWHPAPISNIFAGLGRCVHCGGTMTRMNKSGKNGKGKWVYLICVAARTAGACKYELIPYELLEQAFLSNVGRLVREAPAGNKDKEIDKKIRNAEAALSATGDMLEGWLRAEGKVPSVALAKRIRELEQGREEAQRELDDLLEQRDTLTGKFVQARLSNLKAIGTADPLDESFVKDGTSNYRTLLNTALRETVSSVDIDAENYQLVFHWRHGGESEIVYGMEKQPAGWTQPKLKPAAGANNRKRRSTKAKK